MPRQPSTLVFIVLLGTGCSSSVAKSPPSGGPPGAAAFSARYIGSAACKSCHAELYDRWSRTRMANVVRDPRAHPESVIADFSALSGPNAFSVNDVDFVYGSRWKQRYFKRQGDDYYPLPAQWDVVHKAWRPYHVERGTDWWTEYYPPENERRPTGPTCDGCHSVNYDVRAKTVTEWNVGCERCHGPGSAHAERPAVVNIQNPSRMDARHANDVCIQCHSQGRPRSGLVEGKAYDWPVGYHPGLNLEDFWQLEDHRLGETTFTHFADGTAHKNRMQGNDFVTSQMYLKEITCYDCHDVHGTKLGGDIRRPGNKLCLGCHAPGRPTGPRAATLEGHTHHKPDSPGSQCIACHMPSIEKTISDVTVRSHTFRFISPALTDRYGIPNSCNTCHTDRSTAWALGELKSWPDYSPWRASR